jgi:hypothetical protein
MAVPHRTFREIIARMKISAILPLKMTGRHYADNVARCDILFSSLRAFTSPDIFDRFLIIVPHDEVEAATRYAKAWSDFPVEVIDESEHFGVFKEFSARHQVRNWHRQQIIKLYASELIDTEYFLVFDPDCFATRPFTLDTLLPGGKALTYEQPREREARYWKDSSSLLDQDPRMDEDGIWMTPATLSRTVCRSLHARLEELHGTNWMKVLLSNYMIDWTEYTLYWLNAERTGLDKEFHTLPPPGIPPLHNDESIWFAGKHGEALTNWDAASQFTSENGGIFSVIQSNTGLDIPAIVAKLQPFMPITIQPYDRQLSKTLKAKELYSAIARRLLGFLHKRKGRS